MTEWRENMQCIHCGTENEENSKFCKKCGVKLENTMNAPNAKGKICKNMSLGKFVWSVLFSIILVLLVVIPKRENTKFTTVKNEIRQYLSMERQLSYFVNCADKKIIDSFAHDKTWYTTHKTSLDGTVSLRLFNKHTLILINEEGIEEISQGVGYGDVLSANGNKVTYVEENGELFLYDCKNMSVKKIADDVDGTNNKIKISPNGECVAYVDKENKLFVYFNEEIYEIGEKLLPIGLPDSAKYIYCYSTEDEGIYVKYLDGSSRKLGTNSGETFYFNREHTQLQFSVNGNWYVSDDGNEKIKLFEGCQYGNVILTSRTGYIYDELYIPMVALYNSTGASANTLSIYTRGIDNFKDEYYFSRSNKEVSTVRFDIYFVDEEWNSTLLEEDVLAGFKVDKDGKGVSYIKNNGLYKIKDKNYQNPLEIANDVVNFVMSSDGKCFYYIDSENTLWFKNDKKKEKKIAENVTELHITHDDYALFLVEDNILYSSYRGKKKKRIAEDVFKISVGPMYAEYYIESEKVGDESDSWELYKSDVYIANKKDKFSLVIGGAESMVIH